MPWLPRLPPRFPTSPTTSSPCLSRGDTRPPHDRYLDEVGALPRALVPKTPYAADRGGLAHRRLRDHPGRRARHSVDRAWRGEQRPPLPGTEASQRGRDLYPSAQAANRSDSRRGVILSRAVRPQISTGRPALPGRDRQVQDPRMAMRDQLADLLSGGSEGGTSESSRYVLSRTGPLCCPRASTCCRPCCGACARVATSAAPRSFPRCS